VIRGPQVAYHTDTSYPYWRLWILWNSCWQSKLRILASITFSMEVWPKSVVELLTFNLWTYKLNLHPCVCLCVCYYMLIESIKYFPIANHHMFLFSANVVSKDKRYDFLVDNSYPCCNAILFLSLPFPAFTLLPTRFFTLLLLVQILFLREWKLRMHCVREVQQAKEDDRKSKASQQWEI